MGARNARAEVRRRVLTASRDDRADAALFEVLTERRRKAFDSRFFESFGRHGVTALSSHPRRFSGRNVNKRSIPIHSVNQFQASATNESGVFAGVGRERHRWGASCIAHAHWQPLPRSCLLRLRLVGDEALALLSEVFVHLWRHTGSFEVAFPQAPPGPAFASAMRLLA
jgi:hypothetical protein